jgi:hypothetical protein
VLPLLPVSIEVGPDGVYPVVWHYGARSVDCVAHLNTEADPRIRRVSRVQVDRTDLANDVTVQYARSYRTGNYCASVRLAGRDIAADDTADTVAAEVHPLCRESERRYRNRQGAALTVARVVDASIVYDDTTARLIAGDEVRRRALAVRRVSYMAPEREYGWLVRGAAIQITDPDVSLTGAIGLVERIAIGGDDTITVGVVIYEDPTRDMLP